MTETDPALNADNTEVRKFAAMADAWWNTEGPLATLHAINPLRIEFIGQRIDLEDARVLDVGCGGGILAEGLARCGAAVTGIDLAEESLNIARDHASREGLMIDYRHASAEDMAVAVPGHFDAVTCLELLEHVPDPASVVRACAQAVRPGGSVFFSTINRSFKSFAFAIVGAEYILRMLPRGTHDYVRFIRPSELSRMARSSGLATIAVSGLHFNPLTRSYRMGGNADVNYFVHSQRPETH
jgi:2-polyprenyl-6-hydroxyphenyl methylase/3-demethylubiquinone-9 3-methyltransferase